MSGGGGFLSPQGPRTPTGYGTTIGATLVGIALAFCIVVTPILVAAGVLER